MRAVPGCKVLLVMALASQLAGCELFKEPTPKAGISKSGGIIGSAPSSSETLAWKKQTSAGVTFEAPYELVRSQEEADRIVRPAGGAMTECEAYLVEIRQGGSKFLRLSVSRSKGAPHMAANLEGAVRQVNRNTLAKVNDPNAREEVRAAHFGGAAGFLSHLDFRGPNGIEAGAACALAHAGESYWQVTAFYEDKEMGEIAKKFIASVTIQP